MAATHRGGLLVLSFLVFAGGCQPRDTTPPIDRARAAYEAGRIDEAEQAYQAILAEESDNATALAGLAEIELDRGNLDTAAQILTQAEALDLDRRETPIVQRLRQRYFTIIYEQSRGEGPLNPADPLHYEEALIGLFNRDSNPVYGEELIQLFVSRARRALGAEHAAYPIEPDAALVTSATIDQLRLAKAAYERLLERDNRLGRPLTMPEEVQEEARAIIPALDRHIYDREFDALFNSTVRATLITEQRFDEATNRFRFTLVDFAYAGEVPEEGPERDAFNVAVVREVVVQDLTVLACQVKGVDPAGVPPLILGRTPEAQNEAYAQVEVVRLEIARGGVINLEVMVPYSLLGRTARVLDQYVAWRAENPEGTGEGTGMGSGDGTGVEGTGAEGITP